MNDEEKAAVEKLDRFIEKEVEIMMLLRDVATDVGGQPRNEFFADAVAILEYVDDEELDLARPWEVTA